MLNFTASRMVAFFKAFGLLFAVVALLLLGASDTALFSHSLSAQSLADIRGTNPQACKVRFGDCTDYAIYVVGETNSGTIYRGDSCTTAGIGSFCISCKSGTSTYNGMQMMNPPPSAPIDPAKSISSSCGLDSASTNGTSGSCDTSGVGSNVNCLHTKPFTNCYTATDWGFQ